MKNYLLIALLGSALSSCSESAKKEQVTEAQKPTTANTDQEAISAQMKQQLDDPSSYQPVSFELDDPWTKADSASLYQMMVDEKAPKTYLGSDSAKPAGHRYQHKYRAKNKMGGLVLSDATVVVYPGPKVMIMPF